MHGRAWCGAKIVDNAATFGPEVTQRLLAQFDVSAWLADSASTATAISAFARLVLSICVRIGPLAVNDRQVRCSPSGGACTPRRSQTVLLGTTGRMQTPVLDGVRATLRTVLAATWEHIYVDMAPRFTTSMLAGHLDRAVVTDWLGTRRVPRSYARDRDTEPHPTTHVYGLCTLQDRLSTCRRQRCLSAGCSRALSARPRRRCCWSSRLRLPRSSRCPCRSRRRPLC